MMMSLAGRNTMLAELEGFREQLAVADKELEQLTLTRAAALGLSKAMIEEEFQRLLQEHAD